MKDLKEKAAALIFGLAAALAIAVVALICVFLLGSGLPAIQEIGWRNFLLGTEWRPANGLYGNLPMLAGSLYVTLGALLIGVPFGLLTAVFMAFFCPQRLYRPLKAIINLMVGVPSVVYGFFGLVVLVPFIRENIGGRGFSVLAAALLLGLMILPTIIGVAESALRAVPASYLEGGLALGASYERSVFFAALPAAKSGILAGVVLGLGRAVGETMAVMMVAGNQPVLPGSLTDGVRTLTANIVMEMGYAADLHRSALFGSAVVLFIFILLINLALSCYKRRAN